MLISISIHDSVHYNKVHVSGEVLTGSQLDISCYRRYEIRNNIINIKIVAK